MDKITVRDQDVEDADVGTELKNLPEVDLFEYLDRKLYLGYKKSIMEHGGTHPKEEQCVIEPLGNIGYQGNLESDITEWVRRNPGLCNRKWYESKGFTNLDAAKHQSLPGDIGYNERNVGEYCFGIKGDSDFQLKELLGGQKAFDAIQMKMDNSLIRLLVYMPGNVIPYHLDNYVNWGETFEHLNPKINRSPGIIAALKDPAFDRFTFHEHSTCDEGKVVRHLVNMTDWKWGQTIMIENTHFPRWKAGDIFNIPANIYHLSMNAGIELKMTMIITGVEAD